MARLTTRARNALASDKFAGPNRTYPIEDANHARNAKSRASAAEHAGHMSKSEERSIDRKADAELRRAGHAHGYGR